MRATEAASEPLTIADVVRRFEADGYAAQLAARIRGRVVCFACHEESDAEDVGFDAVHRLEGTSDPAEEVAVAAARCPRCEAKGTLVLTYGPTSPPEDAEVLRLLEDRRPEMA